MRSLILKEPKLLTAGGLKMERKFTMVIEKCPGTGLYVGYIPGIPGAHTQGETIEELEKNMREVLELLLEEGIQIESEFVGTHTIEV